MNTLPTLYTSPTSTPITNQDVKRESADEMRVTVQVMISGSERRQEAGENPVFILSLT
jgi:hypothetical protein